MPFSASQRLVFPLQKRKWLRYIPLLFGAAAIFWICTFKIMDRDFWWHITAGQVLLSSGWISVDPFAHTRAGLPYLATHEWLAQIILHILYKVGGPTGIILFRSLIASTVIGLLLLLTKQLRFLHVLLGVWAIVITKGSFLERPQLFTFVFFSAFVLLAFQFLDAQSPRVRRWICAAFVAMELLWVNMHGGAALLGCGIVGLLFLQTGMRTLSRRSRAENQRIALELFVTLICMAVTIVLPPNGFSTLTYLADLLHDQTIAFIAEWQPREWGLYVRELWPFYGLASVALIRGRRHWFFNGLLLLVTAYLSRQAFRHEILFVLTAVATCFYQFDRDTKMERVWGWLADRPRRGAAFAVIAVLVLGHIAVQRSFGFERQDNLFGFGQFDLARGAYDFVEREGLTGNMFNTYGIGGYLIHRGYPDRKVFIDGRNVDYGLDFMARAYAAGADGQQWDALVATNNINYAIVDYDAIREKDHLPYSTVLDQRSDWPLVYLDDWVAIYLRVTTENQALIDRLAYKHISPTRVQFQGTFADADPGLLPEIIAELERMQRDNPAGIKATIALANIALRQGRMDETIALANTARSVRPRSPEPIGILAAAAVKQENWPEAADFYTELLRLAGDQYPDIDYGFIARVNQQAGRHGKAWWLSKRHGTTLPPLTPVAEKPIESESPPLETIPSSSGAGLDVNPAGDAILYNERGWQLAENQDFAGAEEHFRMALMLNPSLAEAWNNLCALLLQQDRIDEAIEACQRATGALEDYADAYFNLALAYYHQESWSESEKAAEQAKKFGLEEESDQLLLLIQKMKL